MGEVVPVIEVAGLIGLGVPGVERPGALELPELGPEGEPGIEDVLRVPPMPTVAASTPIAVLRFSSPAPVTPWGAIGAVSGLLGFNPSTKLR